MTTYTKEEQITQLMAYMKKVKESGKSCGLCEDLREAFTKEEEHKKKEEDDCECGEKLFICDSGMRLCSVGCKDKWVNSKGEPCSPPCDNEEDKQSSQDTKYIVRFERAVYGDEHGDIMYMDTVDETEYDTLHEAREAYDSYEVQDTGELLYLDMISGEDEEHENVDMRGTID